ncbi:K02A2.6-like [Cordylochernes scorpioides]|uniref:K02A2.6-like n=1 Tax=Cordylochernes scorpioides TaxID=51811 RepID=A0ABY6KBT1_9ARAC|nr:K02A2.6-like [Cordylochernes scorpioides]
MKIIEEIEQGKSHSQVSKERNIPRSTISTIFKNKFAIKSAFLKSNFSSNLKRDRGGEFPEIEEALFRWIRQANAMKLAINGNILKEKAILLALKMGQDNFEASNGWLEKFKARRNIAFKRLHGEAGSVDANSVATWKGEIIPSLLAKYSPQDIFNADETGLFYKLLPNQTMTIRGFVMDEAMEEVVEEEMNRCFEALKKHQAIDVNYIDLLEVDKDVQVAGEQSIEEIVKEVMGKEKKMKRLAKEGAAGHPDAVNSETYLSTRDHINKLKLQLIRNHRDSFHHSWYQAENPKKQTLQLNRRESTQLARWKSGHLRPLVYKEGAKSFPMCTRCKTEEATPQHLLNCIGKDKRSLSYIMSDYNPQMLEWHWEYGLLWMHRWRRSMQAANHSGYLEDQPVNGNWALVTFRRIPEPQQYFGSVHNGFNSISYNNLDCVFNVVFAVKKEGVILKGAISSCPTRMKQVAPNSLSDTGSQYQLCGMTEGSELDFASIEDLSLFSPNQKCLLAVNNYSPMPDTEVAFFSLGNLTSIHSLQWDNQWVLSANLNNYTISSSCQLNKYPSTFITTIPSQENAAYLLSAITLIQNVGSTLSVKFRKKDSNFPQPSIIKDSQNISPQVYCSVSDCEIILEAITPQEEGLYFLNMESTTSTATFQLTTRVCPDKKYGELCDKSCPSCRKGSVCHDITGRCMCQPGYNGTTCENECPTGYFGSHCLFSCPRDSNSPPCTRQRICLPKPFGCSCYRGLSGLDCNLGKEAYNIFEHLDLSDEQRNNSDEIINALTQHFTPKINIIYERSIFNQTNQETNESIEQYICRLRKLSSTCNYGAMTEEMIRDRLVLGIIDKQTKRQLISDPQLTLQKAIDVCKANESANKQIENLTKNTQEEVNKLNIRKETVNQNKKSSHEPNKMKKNIPCRYCATFHEHNKQKCPAWNQTCRKCNKKNHWAKVCKSRMRTVQSLESQNSNDEQEDCYSLEYVSEISARKLMTKLELELNGYKESIICQIDTGATVNVLNFADLCKIMQDGNPSLKPSYIKLRCYGGEILKPRGQIKINCSHQSKQHPIVFQVIDHWEKPILNPTIKPIKQAPRRVPITLRKELKEKLIDMEKKNIIAKVDYPTDWISNLVLVKSTKKLRICIDPQELNVALKRAEYPIPTIEEIIPNLQNAKIFTVVDTKDGFWNVKLSDESSNLTTFWTPFGRYKFLRMPFGLKTASEEYQRRLYEIFQGLEGIEIIADDILILGKGDSYEEALKDHDRNLENLFKTARQANLKFNINKVKLRLKEVKYLGHIITPHGLKPDPEKVKALKEMPHPESITELKSFLGFATYLCKFMPNISMISEPLRKLTMKNSTWSWSKNHQAAFEQIKNLQTIKTRIETTECRIQSKSDSPTVSEPENAASETRTRSGRLVKKPMDITLPPLTIKEVTSSSATLFLENLPPLLTDNTTYFIMYKVVGTKGWHQLGIAHHMIHGNSITLRLLQSNTFYSYYYYVGYGKARSSQTSTPFPFKTLCGVPSLPPQNLSVVEGPPGKVNISWELPDPSSWNCDQVHVSIVLQRETDFPTHDIRGGNYMIFETPPYTNWTIMASLMAERGSQMSQMTITHFLSAEGAPGPVRSPTIELLEDSSLNITWQEPLDVNGILRNYLIKWNHSWRHPCNIPLIISSWEMPVNGTTAILKAIPSSRYEISISAVTVLPGDSTTLLASTKYDVPRGNPQNLKVKKRHMDYVMLSWDPPLCNVSYGTITGYQVSVLVDVPWCQLNTTAKATTSTWMLENPLPFTTYLVQVAAGTDKGISEFTADLNVTIPPTVPGPPLNLTVYSTTESCLSFSWDAPFPPNGKLEKFLIEYWEDGAFRSIKIDFMADRTCSENLQVGQYCHTIPDLNAQTKYFIKDGVFPKYTIYRTKEASPDNLLECIGASRQDPNPTKMILAYNEGISKKGQAVKTSGTTTESVPDPPRDLKVENQSSTCLGLSWASPLRRNGKLLNYMVSMDKT